MLTPLSVEFYTVQPRLQASQLPVDSVDQRGPRNGSANLPELDAVVDEHIEVTVFI
jgi:hypothetical protein